jgi:hypothetical protein
MKNNLGPWVNIPPDLAHLTAGILHASQLIRLVGDIFAYRTAPGEGNWHIGTLPELIPTIMQLSREVTPYVPRNKPPPDEVIDDLLKELGL